MQQETNHLVPETKKYAFVDALRGWAVFGVICAHTRCPGKLGFNMNFIGARGVQLFYVLSAFTLCLSLAQKIHKEPNPLRSFFIRRFFRISPMFYVAAFLFLFIDGTGPSYWAPNGLSWWHIASVFTHLNGWHPETINIVVPGGWSIAIETVVYFVLPFAFLYLANTLLRSVIFTLVLLVSGAYLSAWVLKFWLPYYPAHPQIPTYFSELWLPAQASVFALGICLYHLFTSRWRPMETRSRRLLSFGLLAVFIYGAIALSTDKKSFFFPPQFTYGVLSMLLGYLLFLYPHRFFVNKPMIYLGKISYSVYLLHFLGIRISERAAAYFGISLEGYEITALTLGITLTFVVLVGSVTYAWIEQPGIELGKKLILTLYKPKEPEVTPKLFA